MLRHGACSRGYATCQRTPISMMSCGKWAPWKLTAAVALPYCSPSYTKGEYTLKFLPIKLATKPNNSVKSIATSFVKLQEVLYFLSTGLSYEPRAEPATRRAAAKNYDIFFGDAWHAVSILATAKCGGHRLGPVALFEGEGSDCSTTSVPVARAAMAGARRSSAHGRVWPVGRSCHVDSPRW